MRMQLSSRLPVSARGVSAGVEKLKHYRFWSSSLLWVYDGGLVDAEARRHSLDIRMIDFANTIYLQGESPLSVSFVSVSLSALPRCLCLLPVTAAVCLYTPPIDVRSYALFRVSYSQTIYSRLVSLFPGVFCCLRLPVSVPVCLSVQILCV